MAIRDSLSRFDAQQGLYQVRGPVERPIASPSPQRVREIQRDVIERSKEEWVEDDKRSLLTQKLLRGSPHILVVARAGKVVLVVLFFPAVFLLNTVPKWLFLQILPTGWQFLAVGGSKILAAWNGLIATLGEKAKGLGDFFGRWGARVSERISAMQSALAMPFKQFARWIQALDFKMGQKLPERPSFSWAQNVAKRFERMAQAMAHWSKATAEKMWMPIQKRMEMARERVRSLAKQLQAIVQRGQEVASRFGMRVAQPFERVFKSLEEGGRKVADRCRKAWEPLERLGWRALERSEQIRKKATEHVQQIVKQVAQWVQPLQQVIPAFAPWIAAPFRWLGEQGKKRSSWFEARGKKLGRRIRRWGEAVGRMVRRTGDFFHRWVIRFGEALAKTLQWLGKKLVVVLRFFFKTVVWLLKKTGRILSIAGRAIRQMLFFFLGVIVVSWALARESLRSWE